MTVVALIKILTFIESLFLGIIAITEDPANRANRVFSRYIFCIAASSLIEYMLVTSPNVGLFLFWKQFDIFMFFAVAAFFHFSLLLYGASYANSRTFAVTWYGAFATMAVIEGFITHPTEVVQGHWSFTSVYPAGILNMHAVFVIISSCIALATVVVIFLCMKKAQDRRSRMQTIILFWSSLLLVVTGVIVELIASVFTRSELPISLSSTSGFLIVNPFLTFAVIRYGLLKLTPVAAVSEIMNLMSESVIIADPHGVISYANKAAAQTIGMRGDPPRGTVDALRIKQNAVQLKYEDLRNQGKGVLESECLLEPSGMAAVPVSVSSSPIKSRRWGEIGLIITIRDISERKRVEAIRESAEKLMRHDLRNALTGIYGISSVLKDDDVLTKDQHESVALIYQSASLMNEQIDSYLHLNSIENGSFKTELVKLNLTEVVRYVCANQAPLARNLMVELRLLIDGRQSEEQKEISVQGIRSLLFGMLVNLVKNALEAAPAGSKVTVNLETSDPVMVTVHNKGAIPLEIRPYFFTRNITSGKKTGTGLGTYGAKLIAGVLGCSIDFTTSEENGTLLTVRFPPPRP